MSAVAPTGGGPGGAEGTERLVLLAAGVFTLLAVTAWTGGQLAGLLHGGRWPPVALGSAGAIAVRLPSHLSDPASAWPAAARAFLPAAAVLDGCLVVSTLAVGTLAATGTSWARRVLDRPGPRRDRRRGAGAGAGWAGRRQLAPVTSRHGSRSRGRVVLGRLAGARWLPGRRPLVVTEARHSVLVFGPTQSGKTTSLAIPAILEWDGPLLATSVKADLVRDTIGWRQRLGQTWVYDPTAATGWPAATWSPLAEAVDWAGAQRLAHWLTTASAPRAGLTDSDFWLAAAGKLLAPLLHACALSGRDMWDLVHWLDTMEQSEVTAALVVAAAEDALTAFEATRRRDERQLSSIYTTAELALAAFADPNVVASARSSEIDPDILLTGRHTLYLCGAAHEQSRLQGVFATLVQAVVDAAVRRSSATGRPLDPPLLLVLDEAANIAPLRDLDTLASTAAGLGIQLVTICQDLAQLASRYGTERSRTIANNHRAKLVLSGVSDSTTLEVMSSLLGDESYQQHSTTADSHDSRRQFTSSMAYRRLASSDELRRIRPGHGVLVYGHLPAARLELRPWYGDRELRRRAADGSSATSGAT